MDASTGYPTPSTVNLYNIHLHQQRQNQLQQQYIQHQNSHHQFSDPNTTTNTNTELLWEAHHQHHRKQGNNNNKSNYILSPPEDQDCNYRQPQQHYPSEIYYNNDKSVPNEFYHQQQQQRENPNLVKTEDPTSLFIDSSLHRQPIITTNMHAREDNISESSSNHTLDSTAHKKSNLDRKQPLKTEAKKRPNVVIEKKRYRRESHNAVERRRRNNINDNIKSLGQLLPDNMREGKLNKGSILKGSVVYIHMLNDQLSKYKERLESLQYEAANLSTISTRNSI